MSAGDVSVLLVEDDEDDFLITSELLEDAGRAYDLEWVRDRAGALAAVDRRPHDVCLLDFRLGAHTGLEVAVDVLTRRPDLPIIMLTGQEDDAIDAAASRLGVGDYLVKQRIDRPTLSRAIRYALQRRDSVAALRASEERYALALEGANDALWDVSFADRAVYRSPRWATLLGHPESWSGSNDLLEEVVEADRAVVQRRLDDHVAGITPLLTSEHRVRTADGEERWVLLRGIARRDAEGQVTRMAGSLTDITERKRAEQRLAHAARHDPLTGLANRPVLLERLQEAVERVRRSPTDDAAVLFLDLDRFKVVNDGLGHEVGDELLVAVGARIQGCLRPGDLAARIGGDEFVILVAGPDAMAAAEGTAAAILAALRPSFRTRGQAVSATTSVGIAACDGSTEPVALLRDADTAMYRAKTLGGDRVARFDLPMHRAAVARLSIESALRSAIGTRAMTMHYQPVLRLDDGGIAGFEALARWTGPSGPVSPTVFVPIAEETGLVGALGRQALREACGRLAAWRGAGLVADGVTMSVNVSPRQLLVGDFAGDVAQVLDESGLPGRCLRLELTESVFLEQPEAAFAGLVDRLVPLGVRAHIDDFGTGYSSLAMLLRLPFEALKVDHSFIAEVTTDGDGRRIVDAVASLAHSLDRQLIAEGIETPAQLAEMQRRGCHLGQGWLFAPALPGADVEALLRGRPRPWLRLPWSPTDPSGALRVPAPAS